MQEVIEAIVAQANQGMSFSKNDSRKKYRKIWLDRRFYFLCKSIGTADCTQIPIQRLPYIYIQMSISTLKDTCFSHLTGPAPAPLGVKKKIAIFYIKKLRLLDVAPPAPPSTQNPGYAPD